MSLVFLTATVTARNARPWQWKKCTTRRDTMAAKQEHLHIRVSTEQKNVVRKAAKKRGQTMTDTVVDLSKEYLDNAAPRKRK
jgi:hypothetical protein